MYCIVDSDGVVINIVVASEDFAESIGARPYYEGAEIGGTYAPPSDPTEFEQLRADMDYLTALLGVEL